MTNFIGLDLELLSTVSGGKPGGALAAHPAAHPAAPAHPTGTLPHGPVRATAAQTPTEAGNICRDIYTGAGAWIGGALTAETLGWGAIPGAVAGAAAGRALCRP